MIGQFSGNGSWYSHRAGPTCSKFNTPFNRVFNHDGRIALQPTTKRLFTYGSTDQLAMIGQFSGNGSWYSHRTGPTCSGRHHTSRQAVLEVSNVVPRNWPTQGCQSKVTHQRKEKGIIEHVDGPTPWVLLWVLPLESCDNSEEKRRGESVRRYEEGKPERETPNAHSRRLDSHTQWSHCILKARSSCWLPSAVASLRESVHYDIRKAQLTNSASEIFQKIIQDQLRNVPGTLNISDNVIVFDKTQTGHDAALDAACRRFADVGLTL